MFRDVFFRLSLLDRIAYFGPYDKFQHAFCPGDPMGRIASEARASTSTFPTVASSCRKKTHE
jgi:hypothetical protein